MYYHVLGPVVLDESESAVLCSGPPKRQCFGRERLHPVYGCVRQGSGEQVKGQKFRTSVGARFACDGPTGGWNFKVQYSDTQSEMDAGGG